MNCVGPNGSILKPVTSFADRLIDRGVGNRRERHLILEDFLRLHVVLGALGKIGGAAACLIRSSKGL